MAKVMVSLPDDLLEALDAAAARDGNTRSGYLRRLAERDLVRRSARRAELIAEIHDEGGPASHGGHGTDLVKRSRLER